MKKARRRAGAATQAVRPLPDAASLETAMSVILIAAAALIAAAIAVPFVYLIIVDQRPDHHS
jgi:hypothetical protein